MAAVSSCVYFCAMLLVLFGRCYGNELSPLSPQFYATSCPRVTQIIRDNVRSAVNQEPRMGASLLRLHFHDCFVQGCDGSCLLDDTPTFIGEKTAIPNNNSLRGFEVVDAIKSQLENVCPGVVSCADILAVAARESVVALGGPFWIVPLGRRDSLTANFTAANTDLPSPFLNLSGLIANFAKKGFSSDEMVTLSGAHTMGMARCVVFRNRIYNETNINPSYASFLKGNCPIDPSGDNNLAFLDVRTNNIFDNAYYKNLIEQEGLLHSDQQLFNNGPTDPLVQKYSLVEGAFWNDFAKAMVRMGNIGVLTGPSGEVRTNCRKTNGGGF